jgi:acyl carrier protein
MDGRKGMEDADSMEGIEEKILGVMRQALEDDSVNSSTDRSSCENWDSLHQLTLAVALEEAFGISIEPEEIARMKSYSDIREIVSSKLK